LKRGGPNHPKTFALAEALGIRRAHAVGLLEMLFHFAAQYAPEGDIGKYSDKRIAAALDWGASVSKLVDALTTTGWVDRHSVARLVVHGWSEHADKTVRLRLNRLGKTPIQSNHGDTPEVMPKRPHDQIIVGALPEPVPLPEPLPLPAIPRELPPPLSQSEWPLTAAEIRKHDPAVDDFFILRLVQATMQHCISGGDMEPIDDEDMAAAVKESYDKHTGKNRHGPGLLLNRVPQIMLTWGKENKNGKSHET